jgi:PhzF family phenazine biosynthesis protein
MSTLNRYAAFTDVPSGGNPAGVWVGDALPDAGAMQRIAADVGYSETAFMAPATGLDREIRYYSPQAEVSFCGHATIATGVHLGSLHGAATYRLTATVGVVPVTVTESDGRWTAALTSVDPRHEIASEALVHESLAALQWAPSELDPAIPPARAFAGAWHLVLAATTRARLANLAYDFDALRGLMLRDGLTTVQLIWRENADVIHSRNPFPVAGVVEDPATGAAAAALAGYLRDSGRIPAPAQFLIRQGEDLGRPSRLEVIVPASGGIVVSGTAVGLPDPGERAIR